MTELYATQAMSENLRQRPDVFPALLTTLFEIVLFEECSNQWSLSRPMLSLILVNEQVRFWHVTTTESAPYMCGLMGPGLWTRLFFACTCRKVTESLPLPLIWMPHIKASLFLWRRLMGTALADL
jgi:hypothetical protein